MIDTQFPSLSRALDESLLGRGAAAVSDIMASAWRHSRTARLAAGLDHLATLRSVATIGAIAGALALTAQFLIPTYVRTGLPLAWPLTGLVLLIVLSIWPAAFERAWPDSAFRRLSHRGSRGLSRRSLGEGGLSRRSLGEGG